MVRWLQIGWIRGNIEAFLQDQRGSVLSIMGFGLVVAAGFTALAIDMSYLYVLKGRLQTTADFAVLAAVNPAAMTRPNPIMVRIEPRWSCRKAATNPRIRPIWSHRTMAAHSPRAVTVADSVPD